VLEDDDELRPELVFPWGVYQVKMLHKALERYALSIVNAVAEPTASRDPAARRQKTPGIAS
jgi:hypothetical protein